MGHHDSLSRVAPIIDEGNEPHDVSHCSRDHSYRHSTSSQHVPSRANRRRLSHSCVAPLGNVQGEDSMLQSNLFECFGIIRVEKVFGR